MTIDRYTKSVLTVISLGLLFNGLIPWINPPEVKADVAGMDYYDLRSDYEFKKAVRYIVEDCDVVGNSISC